MSRKPDKTPRRETTLRFMGFEFPSATAYHYKTYDADETETAPKTRRRAMMSARRSTATPRPWFESG